MALLGEVSFSTEREESEPPTADEKQQIAYKKLEVADRLLTLASKPYLKRRSFLAFMVQQPPLTEAVRYITADDSEVPLAMYAWVAAYPDNGAALVTRAGWQPPTESGSRARKPNVQARVNRGQLDEHIPALGLLKPANQIQHLDTMIETVDFVANALAEQRRGRR